MIRNRKKASELHVILSATELPDNNVDSRLFTRDTLCLNLLKVTKRRKMAETISSRYKTNMMLAQEFSLEEVQGELLTTMTQVINAWEIYWDKKNKKNKNKEYSMNLSSNTKLSTFGEITGYFVNAFKNNMSKKYGKFKTEKRSTAKQFIYLDAPIVQKDENSKRSHYDSLVDKNSDVDTFEYKQSIGYLISELRSFDKKENEKQSLAYQGKSNVPIKRQSHLARLFVALLNPRYQGNIDQIRLNLGWTDYIFKRNRDILFKKLRHDYSQLGEALLSHVLESQGDDLVGDIKETEKKSSLPKKLEVHSVFSMKKEENKTKYSLTVSVDEYINGQWKPYKEVKTHELVIPVKSKKALSFDEAKKQLQNKAQEDVLKAKQMVQKY
jgi:hypothetical protein